MHWMHRGIVATSRNSSSAPPARGSSPVRAVQTKTAEEKRAESKRRFQAEREHLKKSPAHRKLLLELAKR
jgi:hypothetical protein